MSPPDERELSTITQHRFVPSPAPSATFLLRVLTGGEAGLALAIDGSQPSRSLLGTSPACALCFSDRTVSRRHASVELHGDRVRLTDLGSANGTRVNGVAVVDAFLVGDERVELGGAAFAVEKRPRAKAAASAPRVAFGRLLG